MGICPYCGEPAADEAALEDGDLVVCSCGHEWCYEAEEETVAEMYERHEEEDRDRWLPGYKEAKEELAREHAKWWDGWKLGDPIPDEPEAHRALREKVRELHAQKGIPPWERGAA